MEREEEKYPQETEGNKVAQLSKLSAGADDFDLDKIPITITQVNRSLICFTGYMQECYTMTSADLKVVEATSFRDLRNSVCQHAGTYTHLVAPFCRAVMTDASNFFDEFGDLYEDVEDLKQNMDVLLESTDHILKGFKLCTKMHEPVTTQAALNV